MKGNYWQTGGVEVAFSFGLFGRFPDFLPLGQQYLPLNRKPRIWLPVVDYPKTRAGSGNEIVPAASNSRRVSFLKSLLFYFDDVTVKTSNRPGYLSIAPFLSSLRFLCLDLFLSAYFLLLLTIVRYSLIIGFDKNKTDFWKNIVVIATRTAHPM